MMFRSQWLPVLRLQLKSTQNFSVLSTHASFPATMYRFQLHRNATLHETKIEETRYTKDVVSMSEDGLVHAMTSKLPPYSNGPIFMPNTHLLQQMLRYDFERYQEDINDGKLALDPVVICIPRGAAIPASLVLWREGRSRFSLQPSQPIPLERLNDILSKFYAVSGTISSAEDWIASHPYLESLADNDETAWMER